MNYRPGPRGRSANCHNPPLQTAAIRAIIPTSTEEDRMFYVAQYQPNSDTVEVIYTCTSEKQAQDECDRQNAHFADAGIPSSYYFFVL